MTEAQGPFFQEGSTGKPAGATAVTAFAYTNKTEFDDIVRRLQNQHRSWLWYKGLNVDLLDSLHAAYLTTAVNEDDIDHPDLNDTLPAAPSGGLNVKWQAQATQNSDSQTPVSAYVPFSSLSIVTAVASDYVVITDASDSANPKRALVSDITALVAPLDAQYVTLATNGTLTNERVLTEGLGIDFADAGAGSTLTVTLDLGEISTGTPSGADTFVFVDADDQIGKRGTAADTLVALGAAPSSTAVTAASVLADNEVPKIDGASRAVQASNFYIDDAGVTQIKIHPADGSSAAILLGYKITGADNAGVGGTGDMTFDAGNNAGGGNAGAVNLGATRADSVSIGRSGKNTQVNGTLGVTEAVTCSSTLASGAQTITQATVGTVFRTEVSTATNDDPTEKFYHARATTTDNGVATLFTLTPATDKHYAIEATVVVRQTGGTGTGTGRTIKIIADIEDIGGTLTVTTLSSVGAGTLSVFQCQVAVSGANVVLTCKVEALGGSGYTYVHHAKIALFGPVGT